MGLETGTYISDLVTTNPISTDGKSVGDDHLRLVKSVLKTTFPNATKPFYFPSVVAKAANYSILSTDAGVLFAIDTTAAAFTLTLPTLTSDDAGWMCWFWKYNTGVEPVFIAPPSGSLLSGEYSVVRARRAITGRRFAATWVGNNWLVDRVNSQPVGSLIPYGGSTLPAGYEWPNGQTLTALSYPEYVVGIGSGLTPDKRGRVTAGKDDMGGSSANRLTGLSGGLNGDTLLATGGVESHTLASGESGQKAISAAPVTITDPGHKHDLDTVANGASGGGERTVQGTQVNSDVDGRVATTGITAAFTLAGSAAVSAHNNVQPTIILNELVVAE